LCCGIGLANGAAIVLIPSGTQLPSTPAMYRGKLIRGLRAGADDCLRIALLSGEEPVAEHNLGGSYLLIHGRDIAKDIPGGAEVEIGIWVDGSGCPHTQISITELDIVIYPSISFEFPEPSRMRRRVREICASLGMKPPDTPQATADANSPHSPSVEVQARIMQPGALMDRLETGDAVAQALARTLFVEFARQAGTNPVKHRQDIRDKESPAPEDSGLTNEPLQPACHDPQDGESETILFASDLLPLL
jgi:hypothetical protein